MAIYGIIASKSIIWRCQILLELNENNPRHLTQMQIANSFGVCKATVSNIVKDYMEQGLDACITYKRNPNSNAKRKADGRDEARITELACSRPRGADPLDPAPPGSKIKGGAGYAYRQGCYP